jgi:hypothetical protein
MSIVLHSTYFRASATGDCSFSGGKMHSWHDGQVYPAGAVLDGKERAHLSRQTQWKTSAMFNTRIVFFLQNGSATMSAGPYGSRQVGRTPHQKGLGRRSGSSDCSRCPAATGGNSEPHTAEKSKSLRKQYNMGVKRKWPVTFG